MVLSWLITGATGQVGSHIVAELGKSPDNVVVALHSGREHAVTPILREKLKFACTVHYEAVNFSEEPGMWVSVVESLMEKYGTQAVVHCAAVSNPKACFDCPPGARAVNVVATTALAALALRKGCHSFFHCSTDMVFDGTAGSCSEGGSFYSEEMPTCPLSLYGRTKVDAEVQVAKIAAASPASTQFIIGRLPLMFGLAHIPGQASGNTTFAVQLRQLVHPEIDCCGFVDEFRTPLSFRSAARLIVALVRCSYNRMLPTDFASAILVHVAGKERVSRYELLQRTKEALAKALLGNELLINSEDDALTSSRMMRVLQLDPPPTPPSLVPPVGTDDEDPACSPTSILSQLRMVGEIVQEANIKEVSRLSFPSSEPRPEDLSMSCAKLESLLLNAASEAPQPLTLNEQLAESLDLWVQLL